MEMVSFRGAVVWWLALLPCSEDIPGSDPSLGLGSFCMKFACSNCLKSYLTDRSFSIQLGGYSFSSTAPPSCGVPQGSIFGPLIFSLYLLPLGSILKKHNLFFHCFAEDVQIYLPIRPKTVGSSQAFLNLYRI